MLYGYFLAYLAVPGTLDSASVVEFVAGLPDAAKYAGKAILAAPFAFHSWNGLRHLAWDSGKRASNTGHFYFPIRCADRPFYSLVSQSSVHLRLRSVRRNGTVYHCVIDEVKQSTCRHLRAQFVD